MQSRLTSRRLLGAQVERDIAPAPRLVGKNIGIHSEENELGIIRLGQQRLQLTLDQQRVRGTDSPHSEKSTYNL